MTPKQESELERIRHYTGTIDDFKSFWDSQSGSDTNAFCSPQRQGYGNVHPTRNRVTSPHWRDVKTSLTEGGRIPTFLEFRSL